MLCRNTLTVFYISYYAYTCIILPKHSIVDGALSSDRDPSNTLIPTMTVFLCWILVTSTLKPLICNSIPYSSQASHVYIYTQHIVYLSNMLQNPTYHVHIHEYKTPHTTCTHLNYVPWCSRHIVQQS